MSQQHPHGEWEGFEQFHDTSEVNYTLLPEIKRNKTNSNTEENLYNISPHKSANRQRKAQRKKSDLRVEEQIDQSTTQQRSEKLSKASTLRPSQEKAMVKVELKRYERIPIIRYEEDCRYAGRVVYKNFIPRTSDKYIKILKEVDWEAPSDKKRDIRNLHGIEFNSQFESGNLNLAIEYDLYMRVDSNTNGHRQWFYFSMKNEKKCRVKLNIYRFKKQYSLFQRGMRPYVKSRKSDKDWRPGGDNVFYRCERQRNQYGVKKEVKSHVLTFYYTFQHQNDQVFVAAGIPYSYSHLQKQLNFHREEVTRRENISFEMTLLCKSMCGLDIPLITIEHKMSKLVNQEAKKKFIIVNARTHSGETSSSWVLDGMLLALAQSAQVEEWLLTQNICLKIVPMLNPDGVFIGNYRTGIIGDDLNRRFNSGRKEFYPEIYALKKLIVQCKKDGFVQLFFDLHGHSILKNSFIYGPSESDSSKFKMNGLPYNLFHNNSKYFRLASCKFKTEKDSIETARGFFQMKQDILSFTCENSLGLYHNQSQTFQMLSGDWQIFGQEILRSMIDTFTNKNASEYIKRRIEPNPSNEAEKKVGPKVSVFTSKTSKHDKNIIRIPVTSKNSNLREKLDLTENSVTLSEQINRQDEILEMKQYSYNEKNSKEQPQKQSFKLRGKSEVMKVPTSKFIQSIINKNKLYQLERKYSGEEKVPLFLGRSSTYDTSQTLKRQIESANQQEYTEQAQYEMEVINQNFSDEYVSINDSDSDEDNLPQQEKNYLFEYIKSNQHKLQINEEEDDRSNSEKEEKVGKHRDSKEPKISGFREIRFKSIEEVYASDVNVKQAGRVYAKKLKLEPHKFKDNTSKTLIYKHHEPANHNEFDDPSLVTFSQQKRLNERNQQRRMQKDPFVLYQRREKLDKLLEKE